MSNAEHDKTHGRAPNKEQAPGAHPQGASPVSELRNGNAPPRATDARAERIQRAWLSRGLRELYQDTASEPIPENFVNLLEELEKAERSKKTPEGEA